MSQFREYFGDSTASDSDTSAVYTTRSRRDTPRSRRSIINRSRSATLTPPQSITTPTRGRSAVSSSGRSIEWSSDREVSQDRRNLPSTSRSVHQTSPTKNKRKPKQPKKRIDKALKEICTLQQSTKLLVPKLPFSRLVREILIDVSKFPDIRVTPECLHALQEVSELYLVQFLQDAYLCTTHRGRVTLIPKDMQLALRLRGLIDPGCK